ncbi:hypothetical protein [Ruficoccus sp. ZRK36]|uniref:rolling circle replication-associated protein n=1 Tax=Ruficoccus sp. ZRK36 TaxID=2866311 RepID=UPI001C73096B|nr:hypothetical protein [Ruficoccus sp. ZRK36]QYY35272.1 hypothetical protein K0V07_13345 [Ruficoccus sp. ZRK36]
MISGTVSPYIPKSWFHPLGIFKVVAALLPRLPDVSGCLFLTFTVNQLYFGGPESAFDYSRARLRKLFYALRKGVEWEGKRYRMDAPYCVKVEFHKNGWAHFHVVFLTKRHLPGALLNQLWGLGRTNVKRINNKDFQYLLKYVCKGGQIPEWVLNRKSMRIFQSSRGFYKDTPADAKADEPATEETADDLEAEEQDAEESKERLTIGERIDRWSHRALFQDDHKHYRLLRLQVPYWELLGSLVLKLVQAGRYLGRGMIEINKPFQLETLESYTS